jgi:hypothetical protein
MKNTQSPTAPERRIQTLLDLHPVKQVEIDGVGMGVMNDGTPYLTARGFARKLERLPC